MPAATVEWIVESALAGELVHVRLTLNPAFCDNTYGDNAIGWPAKGGPMAGGAAPVLPGGAAPVPPGGGKAPGAGKAAGRGGPGKDMAAHTFRDLVGSVTQSSSCATPTDS